MFGIRCVVSDNKLGDVLRVLKGLTLEQPIVEPLDEMPRNETYKEKSASNGKAAFKIDRARKKVRHPNMARYGVKRNVVEGGVEKVMRDLVARTQVERISSREFAEESYKHGYKPGAYSHGLKKLIDDGTLSRDPVDKGIYVVNPRTVA